MHHYYARAQIFRICAEVHSNYQNCFSFKISRNSMFIWHFIIYYVNWAISLFWAFAYHFSLTDRRYYTKNWAANWYIHWFIDLFLPELSRTGRLSVSCAHKALTAQYMAQSNSIAGEISIDLGAIKLACGSSLARRGHLEAQMINILKLISTCCVCLVFCILSCIANGWYYIYMYYVASQ